MEFLISMPYYKWFAINIDGDEYEGEQWAVGERQLSDLLLTSHLGLMWARRKKLAYIEKMSLVEQLQLFEQLQKLVDSGLLITQALSVVSRHGNSLKRALAFELYQSLEQGSSLAASMSAFSHLFNPLFVSLIRSGEESGNLPAALANLVRFLDMQVALHKKIRLALRVPLVTLLFFITILFVIFFAIIPSFERLTISTNQQLPASLGRLISWSNSLQSIGLFGFALGTLAVIFAIWLFVKTRCFKKIKQWFLTHIFIVRTIYWSLTLSFFFRAISLLLHGGVSIVDAMQLVSSLSVNGYVKAKLFLFTDQIASGVVIDEAYEKVFGKDALSDVAAMLAVGSESGSLEVMTAHISQFYFERAERRLTLFAVFLQPALLIIMGVLVAALIYAVYVPITQLPETLGKI